MRRKAQHVSGPKWSVEKVEAPPMQSLTFGDRSDVGPQKANLWRSCFEWSKRAVATCIFQQFKPHAARVQFHRKSRSNMQVALPLSLLFLISFSSNASMDASASRWQHLLSELQKEIIQRLKHRTSSVFKIMQLFKNHFVDITSILQASYKPKTLRVMSLANRSRSWNRWMRTFGPWPLVLVMLFPFMNRHTTLADFSGIGKPAYAWSRWASTTLGPVAAIVVILSIPVFECGIKGRSKLDLWQKSSQVIGTGSRCNKTSMATYVVFCPPVKNYHGRGNPWLLPSAPIWRSRKKHMARNAFLFWGFCFPGLLFLDFQAGPDPVDLMKGSWNLSSKKVWNNPASIWWYLVDRPGLWLSIPSPFPSQLGQARTGKRQLQKGNINTRCRAEVVFLVSLYFYLILHLSIRQYCQYALILSTLLIDLNPGSRPARSENLQKRVLWSRAKHRRDSGGIRQYQHVALIRQGQPSWNNLVKRRLCLNRLQLRLKEGRSEK